MKELILIPFLIVMTATFLSSCTNTAPSPATKHGQQAATLAEANPAEPDGPALNGTNFVLSSPEAVDGGSLPREYTCDGSSATLPLEWSGTPPGTKSLAIVMHTIPAPNESHWYWVLYNIPPDTRSLAKNVSGIGTLGNNSVNGKTAYSPPCSKGPGAKKYTYTIYALSAPPQLSVSPAKVSRDVLLAAIKDRTIASAELNVYYSR